MFSELKNLYVWNKRNGGMGSFYRFKHELIFVFKVGTAAHTKSFGLGETGRYRTNVWDYAGISSLGARRMEELAMHPTVKPVLWSPMPVIRRAISEPAAVRGSTHPTPCQNHRLSPVAFEGRTPGRF